MSLIGSRQRSLQRGATRRRQPKHRRPGGFDRWLDRAVDIAVLTALTVGGVALVLHLLL
ncbi:hypothetical protein OCT51_19275 [Halomonas sp. LR3S48]|uniref:hypothetical protein n=1 Tax=Halomonadaceae TaxID=28256 RepID=UPI0021E44C28|nr:hypothetical protein [Halomonas sp. LR3S48]UYG03298.1 hypothetical protein OCT51_19275 [Halomonas sp. LR3S48]